MALPEQLARSAVPVETGESGPSADVAFWDGVAVEGSTLRPVSQAHWNSRGPGRVFFGWRNYYGLAHDKEMCMTFRPELVALDIDGTLVDPSDQQPKDIYQMVRRIVDAGVPVVLATGRAWHGTQEVISWLDLPPGVAVIANGSIVVEYPPPVAIHEVRFDPAPTIAQLIEAAPTAHIGVTDGMVWRVSKPFPPGELSGDIRVESVEELSARPVSRVVLRDPEMADAKFNELVAGLGLHGVGYYIGWSAWADFVPQGVDKAQGLAKVCAKLGVDRANVLAIGDGNNDVEMLQWAGRGVAMGDAGEEVKAAANDVTGRFRDGGTIAELSRWF